MRKFGIANEFSFKLKLCKKINTNLQNLEIELVEYKVTNFGGIQIQREREREWAHGQTSIENRNVTI